MHLGGRREDVVYELVVRPIDAQLLLQPEMKCRRTWARLVRHRQQVAPVTRPLLGELVARDEGVDEAVALVAPRVRMKLRTSVALGGSPMASM